MAERRKAAPRSFTCPCGRGAGYITKAAAKAAATSNNVVRCGLQAWHPATASPPKE